MWKNYSFKLAAVFFISLIVIIVIVKRIRGFKRKTGTSFKQLFKNLEEKYPQAFEHKLNLKWTGDSKGETQCRAFLEEKFQLPFKKSRPQFLKNPINNALLELDCFNESLKLACEYQGEQHYKFTSHFHKSYDAFQNQQYRDQLKRDLCKKNKIYLIEVPYYVENIDTFLETELEKWKRKHR